MKSRFGANAWRGAAAAFAAVVISACRSVPEPSLFDESILTVVRTMDRVQISWPSRAGKVYTVLFAPDRQPGTIWQPLPQALNLSGTGGIIEIEDSVPEGEARFYRLHVGPYPAGQPVPPPKAAKPRSPN